MDLECNADKYKEGMVQQGDEIAPALCAGAPPTTRTKLRGKVKSGTNSKHKV